ncbi:MAG: hypothetical protein WBQ89_28800, partial [Candidatus Acidiferrum sp.]
MNSLGTSSRLLIAFALVLLMLGLTPQNSLAQTVIQLSGETSVAPSVSGASFTGLYSIANSNLNLSCPAGIPIVATLAGPPNGTGYLLVDNYLVMKVNGNAVSVGSPNTGSPAGNVCTGGVTDGFSDPITGLSLQQDCFSQAYRTAASANSILGDNTDTLTNPGNNVLPPGDGNGPAGGVPPIDVSSYLSGLANPISVSFTASDAGGYVASSSLFLVTNCTASVASTQVTAFIPPTGSTGSNTDLPAVLGTISGHTLISDEDFSASTGLTNNVPGGSGTPIILATETPVTQTEWQGYTGGLPIAPSNIIIDAYNLTAVAGSLVSRTCYG